MRIEKDGLGELPIPEDVYYGIQSFRASKNFTISGTQVHPELIKTFFSGQRYRVVFCKVDQLPKIRFWVTDSQGRVLFDNSTKGYADTWDFEIEKTQMLSVNFMVMEHAPNKDNTIVSGCVAVLFGIADR